MRRKFKKKINAKVFAKEKKYSEYFIYFTKQIYAFMSENIK